MSDRSIRTPTDREDNPIEQARWQQLHLTAATKALRGRPRDIEYLIDCGVLKQQARELAALAPGRPWM